eukprot:scaffold15195_cov40-Attheya_sp.AAC.1
MHQFYLHRDLFLTSTNKEGTLTILRLNRNGSLYKARCDFITSNKWSVAEPTPTITSAIRKSPHVYNKLPTSPVPAVNQGVAAKSPTLP